MRRPSTTVILRLRRISEYGDRPHLNRSKSLRPSRLEILRKVRMTVGFGTVGWGGSPVRNRDREKRTGRQDYLSATRRSTRSQKEAVTLGSLAALVERAQGVQVLRVGLVFDVVGDEGLLFLRGQAGLWMSVQYISRALNGKSCVLQWTDCAVLREQACSNAFTRLANR
jgi:hypothetical protein